MNEALIRTYFQIVSWSREDSACPEFRFDPNVAQPLIAFEGTVVGADQCLDAVTEAAGGLAQWDAGPEPSRGRGVAAVVDRGPLGSVAGDDGDLSRTGRACPP